MKKTILLVEDEALIRKTTAQFLKAKGFHVLEAEDGQEGIEICRREELDAVITDLRMPLLDGMELTKLLVKESPDTPIIIFSGMGKMIDVIDAIRAGAWDYVTKPLHNMEVLELCLSRVLERAAFIQNEKERKLFLESEVEARTQSLIEKNDRLEEEILERQLQETKVLQAKQEWERTVDAMPDMIAIIGRDHRIIRINETLRKKLGLTYEEVHGQKCYACLHSSDKPEEYCLHKRMMIDGKEQEIEVFEEKLGGYCEITASPYHDHDGTLVGSVHIIRNINEKRKEEKERERLNTRLLQIHKLESVGQLASGIAHEINTPTQFISSNISFLEDAFNEVSDTIRSISEVANKKESELSSEIKGIISGVEWDELNEEIGQAIQQSSDGAAWISSIVKAMKDFSHPGSKSKELADINKLIRTTTTVARNEWKYVATIETALAENLQQVPCYADELGQVILNLIVNAAHAIADKLGENPVGEKGDIKIETSQDSSWVTVSISDTGNGIPEEIRNRIFDPFFTTKPVGRGTGQGLAISHDVITKKHNGKISLTSEVGKGTVFKIKLPME